jgi:HD-GYP domain-containing protein (c-di-GMP phosphodiesterase class II)
MGGDEFCILLPQTTEEMARRISNRIRNLCEESVINLGASCLKPSMSMGYSTKKLIDEDFSAIMIKAENSMRRRKLLERKSVRSDLMSSIKATMLEKSHETADHADRLVKLSSAIGEELGLSDDKLLELELAATLHDIGKMSIDQQILIKPGKLTDEEWHEVKKHPEAGYRISQATSELMPISEYILSHHERWDGKGYPQGLKGDQIPLIARIITVVDSYDAMTENRPYRKAMSEQDAIAEILKNSGTQFDPEIARIFIEKIGKPSKY